MKNVKLGDVVNVRSQGVVERCVVKRIKGLRAHLFLVSNPNNYIPLTEEQIDNCLSAFPVTKPACAADWSAVGFVPASAKVKLVKGDRVSYDFEGKDCFGTVLKGGSGKVSVTMDGELHRAVSGDASGFVKCSEPLPGADTSGLMSDWEIKNYKSGLNGIESQSWECSIFHKGKKVLVISDHGNGGEDDVDEVVKGYGDKFEKAAAAWLTHFKEREAYSSGNGSIWIYWMTVVAPYGVSPAEYLKK